ncbi:hypothetical protein GCM10027344_05840 [Spelaeicoccus albus]
MLLAGGGWLALMVLAALAYRFGHAGGGFRAANLSLAVVLAIAALPWLVPRVTLRKAVQRIEMRRAVAGAAIIAGLAVTATSVVQHVWWIAVAALLLGVYGRIVVAGRRGRRLRPAMASAGLYVIGTLAAQLVGGVAAGADALTWLAPVSAILMIAGGVCAFAARWQLSADKFGMTQGGKTTPIWAVAATVALVGAAVVSSQVESGAGGQAGVAFTVLLALCGIALGLTTSARVMPGLSRPRLIALCLISAGVMVIGIGVVTEVTAVAALSGLIGWLGGTAAAAQDAERQPGTRSVACAGVGGGLALLVAAGGMSGRAEVSSHVSWTIGPTDGALLVLGVLGVVTGIVALLVLDDRRLRGIGTEIAAAWKPAGRTVAAATDSGRHDDGDASDGHRSGRGLFIALEGGDGAGKSTQAAAIAAWLEERHGVGVVVTREPGGTETGVKLRDVLLSDGGVPPRAEALLFAADRGHHVDTLIRPALRAGRAVITDRYMDSSIAYQGAGRDSDSEMIADLSRWATAGLLADVTVVLDVDPVEAARRRGDRGPQDHLEKEPAEFHRRVRQRFLDLAAADPDRYVVVDASGDPADVTATIVEALTPFVAAADLDRGEPLAEPVGPVERESPDDDRTRAVPVEPESPDDDRTRAVPVEPESPDDDRTRVIREPVHVESEPIKPEHADYLERLRSQAEAERRARERLRRQREENR